jgi:predicted transcriptional regulator
VLARCRVDLAMPKFDTNHMRLLLGKGAYQSEIASLMGVSQQVVSYHVGKLRRMYGFK